MTASSGKNGRSSRKPPETKPRSFSRATAAVLAVGRHGGGKNAQLLRSKPPYTEWERKDLDRSIGGPLLAKWGDRIVVGGRKTTTEKGPKTALCWLVGDELKEFAELPSGGDNSYPGFVELSPKRALVSYYSSHERDAAGKVITAIYLAELTLKPWKPHEVRQMNGTAGEIRLPAQFQMVTESWNRVVAVPYIIYMPEKDRLMMLVNCDYPHHAEVLFSDDRGASWSSPKPVFVGTDGKPVAGMGTSLCYLGEGTVLFYGSARWVSAAITARRGRSPCRWRQLPMASRGTPGIRHLWNATPRRGKSLD